MKRIDIKGVIVSNDVQWIYDLFDMESTSPKNVREQLEDADGDDVEVMINSGGGEVYAGSEIYTELKDYKGTVTTKIVGVAASAASVIAMAGDKVMISPTAQIMIHNTSTIAKGDHRDLKHGSDILKTHDQGIANAYVQKTGMSRDEILNLMAKETWLNAQQAKEKNFVDEIMFEDDVPKLVANASQSQLLPQNVIDKIRNEFKGFTQKSVLNETEKEAEVMNLEKLKNDYPELYEQVKNEGYQEGIKAENDRIKAIEELGVPGSEELVNKAKFQDTTITAEKLAVEIIKAQKEQGKTYLVNRNNDAEELDVVNGSAALEGEVDNSEEEAIKNAMIEGSKSKRGVK